jgi:hypothetical protein
MFGINNRYVWYWALVMEALMKILVLVDYFHAFECRAAGKLWICLHALAICYVRYRVLATLSVIILTQSY